MAAVQDRLQQNRAPLDKWTTREQLCLASAVSFSGDQNWMSVSRTMKVVCGTGANGIPRPADWYSQKSCAVQYSHLLENVEAPKRKKRTSESNSGAGVSSGTDSSIVAEIPADLILRKLTDERTQELREQIRQNQEEYAKLYKEIKGVQTGVHTEERLLAIWHEMEKEDESKRIDEMKWENQMREREQRKQEMQRNWRTITPNPSGVVSTKTSDNSISKETKNSETTESNIEKNQRPPLLNINPDVISIPQQQQQQQPQTSPLLSSLLKSPTSSAPPTMNTSVVTSSARTSAPTITNLLTGGPIPNTKQPVVIIKNTEVGQLLTRPISGPPNTESGLVTGVVQNLLSPSQCAPTLSLLLEKVKVTNTAEQFSSPVPLNSKTKSDETEKTAKDNEASTAVDSNNDEVPMEIEEDIATNLMESDETDPNEEQQLLEVFENIGNIEMEIDTAFLTAMDEETPTDAPDLGSFDEKIESTNSSTTISSATTIFTSTTTTSTISKEALSTSVLGSNITTTTVDKSNLETIERKKEVKNEEILEKVEIKEDRILGETKDIVEKEVEALVKMNDVVEKEAKVETISSDDSNDNIPLATVASTLDVKDRQNSDFENDKADEMPCKEEICESIKIEATDNNKDVSFEIKANEFVATTKKVLLMENQNKSIAEIASNEDHELIKQETKIMEKLEEKQDEIENDFKDIKKEEDSVCKDAIEDDVLTTTTIDKDDDACTPDIEKTTTTNFDNINSKATKVTPLPKNDQKKEIKTTETVVTTSEDNEKSQAPIMTSAISITGALPRPTAIRKLRERDRSESPMVTDEDEQHTTSAATASRLRRRGSSTPVMDSIPSSPASVSDRDERELRNASKKSLMQIFIAMQQKLGMNIALLEKSFSETEKNKNGAKYSEVCLRPVDFQVIQQNIESNNIRSTLELQRDILLMCQNAVMLYAIGTPQHNAAMLIKQDCHNLNDLNLLGSSVCENKSSCEKESKEQHVNREFKTNITNTSAGNSSSSNNFANISGTGSSSKSRSGFRKSQRIS